MRSDKSTASILCLALGLSGGIAKADELREAAPKQGTILLTLAAEGSSLGLFGFEAPVCGRLALLAESGGGAEQVLAMGEATAFKTDSRPTKDPEPLWVEIEDTMTIAPGTDHRLAYFADSAGLDLNLGYDETTLTPGSFCGNGKTPVKFQCGTFMVRLSLAATAQPESTLQLFEHDDGGGTFVVDLKQILVFDFEETVTGLTVQIEQNRSYSGYGSWSRRPSGEAVTHFQSFFADSDCDGIKDAWWPPTFEAHLGWSRDKKETFVLYEKSRPDRLAIDPGQVRREAPAAEQ